MDNRTAQIIALRAATTYTEFAQALNLDASKLALTIKTSNKPNDYKTFVINKKNGGKRIIAEPPKEIKFLQSVIAETFKLYLEELSAAEGNKTLRQWQKSNVSHGARRRTSIISNGRSHVKQAWVLNIDVKDFFPSIHAGRIFGFLKKDRRFRLSDFSSRTIAYIATYDGKLPQGSPLSPILADLIAGVLDSKIMIFCKNHNLRYSRYIDDISISSHKTAIPKAAVKRRFCNRLAVGRKLESCFDNTGFKINRLKTRLHLHRSRQSVTGLSVNLYPNVRSEFYRETRALVHRYINTGTFSIGSETFDHRNTSKLLGRTSFISHVRNEERARKYAAAKNNSPNFKTEKRKEWPSDLKLEERAHFFINFAYSLRPRVLCEGDTDHYHLRMAASALELSLDKPDFYGESTSIKIRQPSPHQKQLFSFGGESQLREFINRYFKSIEHGSNKLYGEPVIALFDNDEAGRKVLGLLREKGVKVPEVKVSKPSIIKATSNLYVCFLPYLNETDTAIEQMYSEAILAKTYQGKTFNARTLKDTSTTYGKETFAKSVVSELNSKGDFSSFIPLFKYITTLY